LKPGASSHPSLDNQEKAREYLPPLLLPNHLPQIIPARLRGRRSSDCSLPRNVKRHLNPLDLQLNLNINSHNPDQASPLMHIFRMTMLGVRGTLTAVLAICTHSRTTHSAPGSSPVDAHSSSSRLRRMAWTYSTWSPEPLR
jgi:hypothetical protein